MPGVGGGDAALGVAVVGVGAVVSERGVGPGLEELLLQSFVAADFEETY